MSTEFAVVDLFAGPGGLAEGFSSIRAANGARPFRIVLSVEKEDSAFATLRLRSFLRQFDGGFPAEYYRFLNGEIEEPDWSALYPREWAHSVQETLQLELGSKGAAVLIDERLRQIRKRFRDDVILIGGPPCQAYSLVGRARNRGTEGYEAREDHRHFLYKEYIRILQRLMPAMFVMENVKGLLSSSVDGERVFDQVLDDLGRVANGAYRLVPLAPRSGEVLLEGVGHPLATDFVVRAEDHGIPQCRHRVIIVGIRDDIAGRLEDDLDEVLLSKSEAKVTVQDVLRGMPKLRSGLSRVGDDEQNWKSEASRVMRQVADVAVRLDVGKAKAFRKLGTKIGAALARTGRSYSRSGGGYVSVGARCPRGLKRWLVDTRLKRFPNHETRAHMLSDLKRYFFAAVYGRVTGASPKATDFPRELAPDHKNWKSGKFADRFRVQVWKQPATTITSHISKDGHYFIHPDPAQCRSLTVREAARLQTFPDNYFFKGNRTEQYIQVGNAVPPLLARKIASVLHTLLTDSLARSGRDRLKKAS
jgi:DNA (cytosine-5)-methyltransferase 1